MIIPQQHNNLQSEHTNRQHFYHLYLSFLSPHSFRLLSNTQKTLNVHTNNYQLSITTTYSSFFFSFYLSLSPQRRGRSAYMRSTLHLSGRLRYRIHLLSSLTHRPDTHYVKHTFWRESKHTSAVFTGCCVCAMWGKKLHETVNE